MMARRTRTLLLIATVLMAAAGLGGCGDAGWHGKSISGLMPALEFRLTDEDGRDVTERIFEGRPVAMYFGFTNCPDVCPTTLARLSAAVRRLPAPMGDELRLAFVSVDPGRDDPAQLARYTGAFSDNMLGLTGTHNQLKALTRRYRITYGYEEPDADGDYEVSHSSAVFVFDAELEPRLMLLDSLSVAQMAEDLERLLGAE